MQTRTYFVDYVNNRRYPLNGVIPSSRLPNPLPPTELFSSHMVLTAAELPPAVDLRPAMTAVEDQGMMNSCVANSLVGAYEYLINATTNKLVDVSRLFVYYNARYRGSPWSPITDNGCLIYHGVGALSEYGTCLESLWPYDPARVNTQPNAEAYKSAAKHKIVDWLQLKIKLDEMKTAIAQGYPFTFGCELFNSFGTATRTGIVPMPSAAERDPSQSWDPSYHPQQHRYHAMLAVGYSDKSQVFIVRNSWGPQWGAQGYCFMPYAYLSDPKLCFDAWVVRQLAADDFSRERWSLQDTLYLPLALSVSPPSEMTESKLYEIIDVEEPVEQEEVKVELLIDTTSTQE